MEPAAELWLSWTDAALGVVTAIAVYGTMIAFSRIFGQRQFSASSSYDLAFIFALGTLSGRAILVRPSLGGALVGLATLFVLHALTGWFHHNVSWIHDVIQNRPVLLAAKGELLHDGLTRASTSELELRQELRLHGVGSLQQVHAAILERNGAVSIITTDTDVDPDTFTGVVGADILAAEPEPTVPTP